MKSRILSLTLAAIFASACSPSATRQERLSDLNCESVSAFHVSNLLDGINLNDRGKIRMESPQGVKSEAFARIYFVAGDLYHEGTNTFLGRGVWIMNNLSDENSYYWAMPGPATEWTVYPDATQNKAQISKYDHGYGEALSCTRLRQEMR